MVVPTHLSGSGYFTVETVRNNTGSYAGQERNASGSYATLVNIPSGSLINFMIINLQLWYIKLPQ